MIGAVWTDLTPGSAGAALAGFIVAERHVRYPMSTCRCCAFRP